MNFEAPDCKKCSNIFSVKPTLISKYVCSSVVFFVSRALYLFDFLRWTIRWYNAELIGIAGQMDNGVDFLFAGGVKFIPRNVFRIVVVQFSPKRITSHGVNRWTLSHQLNQVNIKSMVLKCCWKGFGKIGTHKPEGAGDKDVHYGWWLIYNGLLRLKTKK